MINFLTALPVSAADLSVYLMGLNTNQLSFIHMAASCLSAYQRYMHYACEADCSVLYDDGEYEPYDVLYWSCAAEDKWKEFCEFFEARKDSVAFPIMK
jgi:hypothetical protein